MHTKITFRSPINVSLQVGDAIYFSEQALTGLPGQIFDPVVSLPKYVGLAHIVDYQNHFVVDKDPLVAPVIQANDFILFAKNDGVNEAGLKGYYADVTFSNASHTKSELFSFGSEITLSSK